LKPFGDHEVFRGAAVRLLNQLQRLDQRDLDILLLDQRRERLGEIFTRLGRESGPLRVARAAARIDEPRAWASPNQWLTEETLYNPHSA
jgi:hypothetical protein